MEANATHSLTEPPAVQRRVWRNLIVVSVAALALSLVVAEWRFAIGIGLGGALALFNYLCLQSSLRCVLAAGTPNTPPGTLLKFVLRWVIVALAGYGAYLTGYFDAAGIVVGLTAPVAAIIVEAAYTGFRTANGRE